MNRKRMIIISLILGSVAAVVAWRQSLQMTARKVVNQPPPTVVMTKQSIDGYAPVELATLAVQEVAPESIPPDAIRSLDGVKNCIAARNLPAGTLLRNSDLLSVETLGLAAEIPPGRRALTIETEKVANVGGVLKPGRFVDVLATFDDKLLPGEGQIVKTVIQNAQVIAVYRRKPTQVEGEKSGGEEPDVNLVTLAVTPTEANLLVLADVAGKLRLSLRPLRQAEWESPVPLPVTSLRRMLGAPLVNRERAPRPGPAPSTQAGTVVAAARPVPTSRPVRSGPPPDFGIGGTLFPAPRVVPSLPVPAGERPAPAANMWRVKVIRGTEVETVMVPR